MGYAEDITLEKKFSKLIKAILGNQFIIQDEIADKQEGTDFLIMTVKPFRVAVRLRRYKYFLKYPKEFTIRWNRPLGVETERHKIEKGYVDYLLYGFVDEAEENIIQYFIGDLKIYRDNRQKGLLPVGIFPNNPPDSNLAAFKLAQFPNTFILKQWQQIIEKSAGNSRL
jgi:hypothetical protein